MSDLTTTSQPAEPSEMGVLDHLNELRKRLTWAAIALVLATIISFAFANQILEFLVAPYGGLLQTIRPTEGLETFFKVSLLAGAVFAMPVIMFQIGKFLWPGLEKKERKYVYIFVPATTGLFLLGVSFAWYILLPAATTFLSTFMPDIFITEWTSTEYIGFITTFLFWIGVSFEMPVIIYALARTGTVSAQTLREQWRFALVAIAVIAAAVTPTVDPVTMLLTMAPLSVLYVLSFGLARLGERQFARSMSVE